MHSDPDAQRVLHHLPASFSVTENIFIPLADGTRLSARVWLPKDANGTLCGELDASTGAATTAATAAAAAAVATADMGTERYPAVLEYIPYRKRDGTRARDEPMHGFFCGHGYAAVRVDMRGSGESDGVLRDEYLQQEQDDALEVIAWIAAQPWCTGDVGMMGKSWGGFNSLQVAARRPPALRAIIVLGFTDNRFKDDIHWKGGCLLNDNFWWGSLMQAFLSQPPDPAIVGQDEWQARWLRHLKDMPFNAATWAAHQTYDSYWKHGSVCEDYGAIQVPVLMVDGWADSYTNPVFRLLQHLSVPCRAIVGPWVHAYPQDGTPSPRMNFLREAVDWWDHWLKGRKDNGAMAAPKAQLFVEEAQPPCSAKPHTTGVWYGLPSWPAPALCEVEGWLLADRTLHLTHPVRCTGFTGDEAEALRKGSVHVHTPLNHGLLSGEWMGAGVLGETAPDQRLDNGMAVCFTSAPLVATMTVLGQPTFTVALRCNRAKGFLFAQLCDVAPDGAATRITYGLKNLVHTGSVGDEGVQLLGPAAAAAASAAATTVAVELDYCGYTVPAGHRLCLSVANNYWPMVWPSPEDTTLTLDLATAVLRVSILPEGEAKEQHRVAGPARTPEVAPPTPMTRLSKGRVDRTVQYDIVSDTWTCVTDGVGGVFGEGVYRFDDIDTTIEHNLRRELTLSNRDPLSAHYSIVQRFKTSRPGWSTQTDITTTQHGDAAYLHLRTHMVSRLEGEVVFEKNWYERVPRVAI